MLTVSGKCMCDRCETRTGNVYRMVGRCSNCQVGPVLMIFREGDKAGPLDCPKCGNYHTVMVQRPATDDEIPAADPVPYV